MEGEDTFFHKSVDIVIDKHKKIKPPKDLKRIDWGIVKRLVTLLYYNNKIKKTNIAMNCNMSYDKCVRYLDFLSKRGFINKKIENGFELIKLSDRGMELFKLLKDSGNDFKI